MNSLPQPFKTAKRRVHHKRHSVMPPTPPVALLLVAASYDTDEFSVTLVFDRAVNAAGLDASAITVDDGEFAAGLFVGSGPATIVNPTTIKIFLEEIGGPTVSDVELSATGASGIVAVDDGGTWEGAAGVVLPFP